MVGFCREVSCAPCGAAAVLELSLRGVAAATSSTGLSRRRTQRTRRGLRVSNVPWWETVPPVERARAAVVNSKPSGS